MSTATPPPTSGSTYGVYWSSNSKNGIGVRGYATATAGRPRRHWSVPEQGRHRRPWLRLRHHRRHPRRPSAGPRARAGSASTHGRGNSTVSSGKSGPGTPAAAARTGVFGYAAQDTTATGVRGESTTGRGVDGCATTGIGRPGPPRPAMAPGRRRDRDRQLLLTGGLKSGTALRTVGRVRFDKSVGIATIASATAASPSPRASTSPRPVPWWRRSRARPAARWSNGSRSTRRPTSSRSTSPRAPRRRQGRLARVRVGVASLTSSAPRLTSRQGQRATGGGALAQRCWVVARLMCTARPGGFGVPWPAQARVRVLGRLQCRHSWPLPRSRRALLAAAAGAVAATVVAAVDHPATVLAGSDGDVVLGAHNTATSMTAIVNSTPSVTVLKAEQLGRRRRQRRDPWHLSFLRRPIPDQRR